MLVTLKFMSPVWTSCMNFKFLYSTSYNIAPLECLIDISNLMYTKRNFWFLPTPQIVPLENFPSQKMTILFFVTWFKKFGVILVISLYLIPPHSPPYNSANAISTTLKIYPEFYHFPTSPSWLLWSKSPPFFLWTTLMAC